MRISLVQSRFRGIYAGLLVLWIAVSLSVSLFLDTWVFPGVMSMRAHEVESLIRSHEHALQFYDNRAIRDELLRSGVIAHDQDFDELRPSVDGDRVKIKETAHLCRFLTSQTCVGPKDSLIYSDPVSKSGQATSFVIRLTTHRFSAVSDLWIYKVLGSFAAALILTVVGFAIRHQERFLLKKLALLIASFSRVEAVFRSGVGLRIANPSDQIQCDEFTLLSNGITQAGELLEAKTRQIEEYKRQFESKTRLEQLAQTITYTSHNLKAPLLEGAEFMRDLPEFIDTMPREDLLRAIKSLENRLRSGATSLQSAMQSTRESQLQPEPLQLHLVFSEFKREVETHPQLKDVKLDIDMEGAEDAAIYFSPHEINSVFWNLLTNSLEAKRNGRIRISVARAGESALVRFSDNGPGIPDALLEMVFNDFFTTKSKGSGLGLPGVKRSIERGRGTIRAVSSTEGAMFDIWLPLVGSTLEGGAHV